MDIHNENGVPVNIHIEEKQEQDLASEYITENDIVLELGGRYGSVSCIINHKLNCKTNHVVVEPDSRVWDALERNKRVNNCQFHIIKGFISSKKLGLTNLYSGYGTTSVEVNESSIPSYPLQDIKAKYNLNFNTLVADCEGFLETFFDENPSMYDDLHLVIFEADYADKCNYDKIRNKLKEKGFQTILHGFQNVWMK